jgi:hypothetical protein
MRLHTYIYTHTHTKLHSIVFMQVMTSTAHIFMYTICLHEVFCCFNDFKVLKCPRDIYIYVNMNIWKPDGISFHRETCKWTHVDYTRSSGSTRANLVATEDRKREAYRQVKQAWQGHKSVEIFPLASSYNGAVAVDTWRQCMDAFGIEAKHQDHVLATAVQAICVDFSSMVDIRYIALNEHRIGHTHLGQHNHNP